VIIVTFRTIPWEESKKDWTGHQTCVFACPVNVWRGLSTTLVWRSKASTSWQWNQILWLMRLNILRSSQFLCVPLRYNKRLVCCEDHSNNLVICWVNCNGASAIRLICTEQTFTIALTVPTLPAYRVHRKMLLQCRAKLPPSHASSITTLS
jgi:hypothetical protein